MDSANSESMQSSSGGDEEYDDSRAALSIFMDSHSPSHHLRPISTPPPPLPPLFDSLPNYTQIQNPNTPCWPRPATMRSDPNPSSSHATIFEAPTKAVARNSRKRSRASRRDPTTVLTTDTANFRAMVQEFTGIPSPPFNTSTSSSSFSRTRLDLFGTRSTDFEAAAPYLRRPSSSTPINYQLPIIQNSNLFNVQNPNSSFTCLLQSNPKFVFSSSSAITSKLHDQDSFGIPTNEFYDFDFNLDENHASTTLSGLPNLVSPDQIGAEKDPNDKINSESHHYRQIKETAVCGGYTAAPVALKMKGEGGMVESWITSSEEK